MNAPKADRDLIALTLAIGICTALNLVTLGVMIAALRRGDYQLSENATQILTGWGGGMIGVLGAVFGYKAGQQSTPSSPPYEDGETRRENPEPP